MLKAVFFDLGHTLTREVNVSKRIETLLKPYNLNWKRFHSCWKNLYFLRSMGKISSDREMFSLLERILERKNMPLQEIKDIIIFESHIIPEKNIKIIKEVKKKYKVGLITNFVHEWIEKIFKTKGIHDLFDFVLVSSEIGVRKPNAEIFYIALKQFSIRPDEAVFVSDDFSSDLICAKGCGIKTIWLDKGSKNKWKKKEREIAKIFKPDAVIKSLKELKRKIKELEEKLREKEEKI